MQKFLLGVVIVGLLGLSAQPVQAALLDPFIQLFAPSPSPQPTSELDQSIEKFKNLKTFHSDFDVELTMDIPNPDVPDQTLRQKGHIQGVIDSNKEEKTQNTQVLLRLGGQAFQMHVISLKEGKVFLQSPLLSSGQWFETSIDQLRSQGLTQFNPQSFDYSTQGIGFLNAIKKETVKKVGEEKLGEVETEKYTADIDNQVFAEQMKAINQAMADGYHDSTITSTIWVGKDSRDIIRTDILAKNLKTKSSLRTGEELSGTTDASMKINYSQFNEPLEIKKPETQILPVPGPSAKILEEDVYFTPAKQI